jgi:hypothetical protein
MSSLQAQLTELAQAFADAVLDAVRGSPLLDLIEGGRTAGSGRSTPRSDGAPSSRAQRSSGRLPRRSAEDIAKALDQVVSLVKKHSDGLRAEQIRDQLGLQPKEMPRILK